MRISSVRIQNFRSFKDETIEFDDYTCLVGANGTGKSNVLNALNVFFHDTQTPGLDPNLLQEEDFHLKKTDSPIEITVTFSDLNDDAQDDFKHYYRQGQLIVSAVARFNPKKGGAEVKQFGQRLGNRDFVEFFEAEKAGEKVPELKEIYNRIREACPKLPKPGTKPNMIQALNSYEEEHPESCELIPSEDQFYGVSKGINKLEKYIQWVFIPAVKDASTEHIEARNTALGKLLNRTVRVKINFDEEILSLRTTTQDRYEDLLTNSQNALKEISNTLETRFKEWAHPEAKLRLEWRQDPDRSVRVDPPFAQALVGEGEFEGELIRFGHGLQRSFLLALLQELSGSNIDSGPRLVLACEEPELYQHPPQARHLYSVLLELSGGNSQVIVSTHSPYFISGEGFESVRFLCKNSGCSEVSRATYDEVSKAIANAKSKRAVLRQGELAKINQALQPALSEMFFAPIIILTEGLEDVAYITTYLHLLNLWHDYRCLGCHIIPVNGKSELLQPLAIANILKIPVFTVFDADGNDTDSKSKEEMHRIDNTAILKLYGLLNPDPFPNDTLWADAVVMWKENIEKTIASDIGPDEWDKLRSEVDLKFGNTKGLRKNTLHIADSLYLAWKKGKRSTSLEKLCNGIIEFGYRKRRDSQSSTVS